MLMTVLTDDFVEFPTGSMTQTETNVEQSKSVPEPEQPNESDTRTEKRDHATHSRQYPLRRHRRLPDYLGH